MKSLVSEMGLTTLCLFYNVFSQHPSPGCTTTVAVPLNLQAFHNQGITSLCEQVYLLVSCKGKTIKITQLKNNTCNSFLHVKTYLSAYIRDLTNQYCYKLPSCRNSVTKFLATINIYNMFYTTWQQSHLMTCFSTFAIIKFYYLKFILKFLELGC